VGKKKEEATRKGQTPRAEAALTPAKAALFLLITLALPFLLFGLLEAGLRAADYGPSLDAFTTPASLKGRYRLPSESLGTRYFPQEQFPPTPAGDPFLVEKPANSLRIFVLGESSAAGFPYSANGTFSRVLRDALRDVLPSDTVEVVNLGMAATNSYTIADVARDVIRERPDAILIYGGHNEYYGALGAGSTESLGSFPGLVRLYLRLQHMKTFLLLRNETNRVLAFVRGGRSAREIQADATRMESVVGDQRITLRGETYERGLRQYESNLMSAIESFRAAGVPVFLASTPSNIRDLRPFGPSIVPPDMAASVVFDSARSSLESGDISRARALFTHARDLDVVRFRAPSDFQAIVRKVSTGTGSTYVPAAEAVARESQFGIPGSDLFLEHVHLNQRGYVLLARAFYETLASRQFLGRHADTTRFAGWDAYTERMRLTDLDHRIAYHTIRTVTTRWPFLPVARQLDYRGTYRPSSFFDSVAFNTSRGGMSWAQAKGMVAERYASSGETDKAIAELEGLIRDGPQVEVAYRLAARTLLAAGQPARAKPYLVTAHTLAPSAFSAFNLGVISMQEKDAPRAITMFQAALGLSPDMPDALFQLSLAYAVTRNIQGARTTASRLAQVEPRYPGLSDWLVALGLNAP
jgi:tetratricopeptide (TPR) repeat protein